VICEGAGATGAEATLIDRLADLLERCPDRPSWDEYVMATALLIASRSACGRLHVGCVLVSGGEHSHRIVAAGDNGFLLLVLLADAGVAITRL
jgi:dCMP deaminase